jgi:hypothetical protein
VKKYMARTRSIKPGFFDNEVLGGLPPLTRLLFIGLWCIADREGRLEDRPKRIKKTLLGYDDVSTSEVSEMLQALHDTGFIIRYTVDGEEYIQVVNFAKHQNPHVKEKPSEIPAPPEFLTSCASEKIDYDTDDDDDENDEHKTSPVHVSDKHQTSTVQAPPITVNRLPSTGNLPPGIREAREETCAAAEQTEESKKEAQTLLQKRFDLFWAAYPKKVGKKDALKAFKNAKVDSELFDKIMTAIGRARTTDQWQRDNGRYIPNPSTWLNQGRWDDEYKEANTNGEYRSIAGTNGQEPAATKPWRTGAAAPGFKLAGETDDPDNDREEE